MNYKIPKDREEAIKIFNKIMDDYDRELVDIVPNKYVMFIGALTECSNEEFKLVDMCTVCFSVHEGCKHIICKRVLEKIFSKRWNE